MYSRNLIWVVSFLIILLSCEKDDHINSSDECTKTVNRYLANGSLHSWDISYYENENLMKKEYSFGDFELYEYDNLNNVIRSEFHSTDFNNIIIKIYSENQIQFVYVISDGDTTYWESYNYKNELLDYVETSISYSNYYYGQELDSILTYYESGILKEKVIKRTENEKLIYQETSWYNSSGELNSFCTDNFEYSNNVLIREIKEYWHYAFMTDYSYTEHKHIYENGLLVRSELFYSPGTLNTYQIYQYDDSGRLVKQELFDFSNSRRSYEIIKYSCN